jgi:hypothetical protein
MSEILSPQEFTSQHVELLQPHETALHGMVFPGVYPVESDLEQHYALRAGAEVRLSGPFQQVVRKLVQREVDMQWLRVIPDAGLFGYDAEDVRAMHRWNEALVDATDIDLRTITFNDCVPLLQEASWEQASPLFDRYLSSASSNSPQSGFWRIDHADTRLPKMIDIIDYEAGVCLGHAMQQEPFSEDALHYTETWQNIFLNHAKRQA